MSVLALALCAAFAADRAYAAKKNCEANYALDNAGTIMTGWKDLGEVGGTLVNKKKKCKEKAIANCAYAKEKLTTYAPVGSANFTAICNAGKLCVYFDSQVEGKKNSKDGTCCTPVACKKSPVVCTCPTGWAYDANGPGNMDCKRIACQPIIPNLAGQLPPNTGLGSWGFTWGNAVYQWGPATCTGGAWIGY